MASCEQYSRAWALCQGVQTKPLSHEIKIQHDNSDITRDALPNTAHFAFFFVSGEYLSANRTQIRIPCTALKAGGFAIVGFASVLLLIKIIRSSTELGTVINLAQIARS